MVLFPFDIPAVYKNFVLIAAKRPFWVKYQFGSATLSSDLMTGLKFFPTAPWGMFSSRSLYNFRDYIITYT
jgi:hypothetical protein